LRYKHGHNGEGPKNPYVLYYGDYDPSRLRMSQNIQRDLAAYGINFVRVGLVHQQISEFGLDYLQIPDPGVMAKLSRQESKHGH
jgi:hypothetical protein